MKRKIKKNKALFRLVSVIMSIILVIGSVPMLGFAENVNGEVAFATLAGLSYVADEYRGGYNDAFLFDAKANNLQYAQLDGLMNSSFASLKKRVQDQGLKYILIDGDLTYNGEYYNHMAVAEKLKKLEAETGVSVIVCNGDKDIYNINASTFRNGTRESATFTNPNNFKTIYADLGYDIAANKHKSSYTFSANLSYSVELDGGYRLIVIDGSYFDPNGVTYGRGDTAVHGRLSDDLLEWIKTECRIAQLSGQTVIGMCHWSISGTFTTDSECVLQNADEVANVLADAGMHYIYTAGSGKNDISAVVSDNGNVIYDIQTGSLLSYPNTYRVSEFSASGGDFDIVDADEVMPVRSYDDIEYSQPYRVTSSLKIQYADYDMARYIADIVENYVSTVLIPGVKKNGTLESFVRKQHGVSLTELINERMGGGLNLLGILVIFDGTNVMQMLEDMYTQAQTTLFDDPKVIGDSVYKNMKKVCDTELSNIPCTQFLETYGFGNAKGGGTVNDLLLSIIAYSYYGNEDSSNDKFVKDVIKNLQSGKLVPVIANVLGKYLIKDLLFGDILSKIELKPQYLIFLDDSEGSIGSYLQIAFRAYLALHGENQSVTGAVNAILSDGFFKQYGRSIDEIIDYFVGLYYSDEDAVNTGKQLADILSSYTVDADPKEQGDFDVAYDGTKGAESYASKANYRLPSMVNVTLGDDPGTQAYITWYTKSTVTGTDIEIYDDENSEFYGGHFVGVSGVTLNRASDVIERSYYQLDLGFASLGEVKLQLRKHVLKVSGLTPGQTYCFRIGDSSKKWWSDTISIKTADGSDSVTFIHVSDTQGNSAEDFSIFNNVLGCADQLYPDMDFVLHTGNYVDDVNNINQWQMFFDGTEENLSGKYILPVAGSSDSLQSVKNTFTVADLRTNDSREGAYYSYNYNNIHIAVLDSSCVTDDGLLTDEQMNWLETDLSNTTAKWKFVAVHEPVYTNGASVDKKNYVNYMNQLAKAMDAYGVDLVFAGSDCVYYRTDAMQGGVVTDVPKVSYPYYNNSDKYYKTIVNPTGTVYSAVGSAGVMSEEIHELNNVSKIFNESGINIDPTLPMFSAVEIKGNTLYLTTYTVNSTAKRAIKVDSVSVKHGVGLKGDVNGDGKVTPSDARSALRACVGLELMTNAVKAIADMNGDGKLTAADARIILRVSAGLEANTY